jgi:AcrR family transcriptional regulator
LPRVLTDGDVAGFRERLCEVATRIFVEKGRDGLSMRTLARQLGVSAMTPYRYFRDKEEILAAIRARAFARFADQLEEALAQPGTPPEKSAAVGRAYVRFALEEQVCYRLMFDLSQPRMAPLPELFAAERRARATMSDHVRLMVREGYYAGDPDKIGFAIWAAMHGVVTLHLAGKLAAGGEFEMVLGETMRAVTSAYRVR